MAYSGNIAFSDIVALVARFGNKVVTEQANLESPFIGKGVIKKSKHSGTVGIVNVKSGGLKSTEFIADGGPLPAGSDKKPIQMAYHPKALFTRLTVPRIAALTAISKQDGVNLVREQMETAGADLGRTLGRALFSSYVITKDLGGTGLTFNDNASTTSQSTALSGGAAKFYTNDASGMRIGNRLDGFENGTTDTYIVITDISTGFSAGTPTTNTHEVSFDAFDLDDTASTGVNRVELGSGNVATLAGAGTVTGIDADTITSLLDLASPTVTIGTIGKTGNYSNSSAAPGSWSGSSVGSATTALTLENLDKLSKDIKRKSGRPWTHTVMNSESLHAYMNLLVSNRQFVGGGQANDASTGAVALYEGKPVIVDENMPDTDILIFTDTDTKLAVWRDFAPDSDGKSAAMVSDQNFVYDTQLFGLFNVRCVKRSGLGKLVHQSGAAWA